MPIRSRDIHIAVSTQEMDQIKKLAEDLGLNVSDTIRFTMREKIKEAKEAR